MELTWNLKHLYNNEEEWEKDIDNLNIRIKEIRKKVPSSINTSEALNQFLKEIISIYEIIERAYCYKRRCIDLDSSNDKNKEDFSVILNIYSEYQEIENIFHKVLIENKEQVY